jgi:hypothetical protein
VKCIPKDGILLEDMDLDADIKNIEFTKEEEQRTLREKELIVQETTFDGEESLTLHNTSFDKELKKMVFESVNSRGKRVKDSTMDLKMFQHPNFQKSIW